MRVLCRQRAPNDHTGRYYTLETYKLHTNKNAYFLGSILELAILANVANG